MLLGPTQRRSEYCHTPGHSVSPGEMTVLDLRGLGPASMMVGRIAVGAVAQQHTVPPGTDGHEYYYY